MKFKTKPSMTINVLLVLLLLSGIAFTGFNCSSQQQQNTPGESETKPAATTPAITEPHITKADGTPVLLTDLDQTIPELMRKADIPGISIAVFNDSNVLYSRAFGVKNTETGEPVTENTLFEAASLTKPLLAYIAMKLQKRYFARRQLEIQVSLVGRNTCHHAA